MKKVVVFTDLDGTFLDHHTYSYELSLPGLEYIRRIGGDLVLVSSKTLNEMKVFHEELHLQSPLVFENGGGIAWFKEGNFTVEYLGTEMDILMKFTGHLEQILGRKIIPLTTMTVDDVVSATELSPHQASQAMARETTIPFLFEDGGSIEYDSISEVNRKLQDYSLSVTRGGRFCHLKSSNADKGRAVARVISDYTINGTIPVTVAVGDSENDLPMLECVDYPFLVRKHDGSVQSFHHKRIEVTEHIGPAGFTEAVTGIEVSENE